MPLAKTQLERNTFVRGLITEASPLTFPENASLDENNFVLNRDGSRQRRLGMELENNATYLTLNTTPKLFDDYNISSFRWKNINNKPTLSFGVIQVGSRLWFVDLFTTELSNNVKGGGAINVNDSLSYNISGNALFDYASIEGKLVIVSKELQKPLSITYDETGDTFSISEIDIEVRDIWGVDDGLDVDEQIPTIDSPHVYNLFNQGWPEYATVMNVGPNILDLAHNRYRQEIGVWPANNQIWHFGKVITPTSNSQLVFLASPVRDTTFGTSPAPKGHFIIDAFNRGASRIERSTLTTGLPTDAEQGRLTSVTSFASRVFYSGVESNIVDGDDRSPNYSGTIFFSKIIQSGDDLGKCHSQNDPTSEELSDLLATDGGTIKIVGAGNILRLVPLETSLVAIADNGVWEITGREDVFKADDFSIRQITNIGASSKGSVVVAESAVMYWGDGGIYVIQSEGAIGRLSVQNITETTIQTFYQNIPSVGRANSLGSYDPASRKVSWLYNDEDDYDGVTLRKKYNRELVFDTTLSAFYTNTIPESSDGEFVSVPIVTEVFNVINNTQFVIHNGDQVQVNGEDVVVTETVRSRGESQIKYVVFKHDVVAGYQMSFAQYSNELFKDWGEIDAKAFLVTGHELFGDTMRKKQVNYLITHFKRTETGFVDTGGGNLDAVNASSAKIRARWDFANSANSGKWGSIFQAYRLRRPYFPSGEGDTFDYGWEVITTKNRLRGSGRALSLLIESEPEKDLYILGWALDITGATTV